VGTSHSNKQRDSDWYQVRKDFKEAAKGYLGESTPDKGRARAKALTHAEAGLLCVKKRAAVP